jgi:DnaJ-class molecular chaperone
VISGPPLLIECDDCSGCGQITHDHANDPWAKAWTCSMCDGTGEVIAGCACCREDATERFDGLLLCELCAAEQRADALLESAP